MVSWDTRISGLSGYERFSQRTTCLGRPPLSEFLLHHLSQHRVLDQCRRFRTTSPPDSSPVAHDEPDTGDGHRYRPAPGFTVETARPNRTPIKRSESPAATPRETSSRSVNDRCRGDRLLGSGRTPPQDSTKSTDDAADRPRPRPINRYPSPACHPTPNLNNLSLGEPRHNNHLR